MIRQLAKVGAFLRRDFHSEVSYRLSFLLSILAMFLSLAAFYLWSGMVDPDTKGLDGIRPFDYMLMGLAFQFYFSTALNSFSNKIRSEQMMGTLEAMLVSPTPTSMVVFCSASWPFAFGGIRIALYLLFATFVFDVRLHWGNLELILFGFLLTLVSSAAVGILSASFVLYFKRGDPVSYLVNGMTLFFGTVFFPIEQIQWSWLRPVALTISEWMPIALSLKILRGTLLQGRGWPELSDVMFRLTLVSLVLMPTALLLARVAIRRAKKEGTLVQY